MSRRRFHLCLSLFLLGLAAALTAPPAVDLTVAAWFYNATQPWPWTYEYRQPWRAMYEFGCWPTWIMAFGAVGLLIASSMVPKLAISRRRVAIIVLAVALGPGLVINLGLKENWGRPRPNRVEQFGKDAPFQAWWQPGNTRDSHSFASGHVSMTFALLAGTLTIENRHRRRWATAAAVAFGLLMVAARVISGAHWLSDAAISSALTYLVVSLLLYLPAPHPHPTGAIAESGPQIAA